MIGFDFRTLSIVDWQFRAVIVAVFAALAVSSWKWIRSTPFRVVARVACLPVVVAFVAASINAHFDYFPTVGALLGRTAADQISASQFLKMEKSYLRSYHGAYHFGREARASTAGPLPVRGVVLAFSIPGTSSHFPARTGQVYLPPAWFENPHPHLPVIELLHGSPGSPADWTRGGGADVTADSYAQLHHGFAPILVMPDVNGGTWIGDSECVNGPLGNAETYLTMDVRNAVVNAFGARKDGAGWAVAGLSEGGSCALQMGLRHPNLFAAIGDFSGDDHPWVNGGLRRLFWGSTPGALLQAEETYDPRVLLARWHAGSAPAIVFSCGRHDRLFAKMQRLAAAARRVHIDTTVDVLPGGHTFWLWNQSFSQAMPWLLQHMSTPAAHAVSHGHRESHPRGRRPLDSARTGVVTSAFGDPNARRHPA